MIEWVILSLRFPFLKHFESLYCTDSAVYVKLLKLSTQAQPQAKFYQSLNKSNKTLDWNYDHILIGTGLVVDSDKS